ncbi:MAG: alkaline phosphatase D family protein [Rhodospirillales bacterium]|nr:MAG: alkaline phosphatase D family protein [Rhodospirillales bacterium]
MSVPLPPAAPAVSRRLFAGAAAALALPGGRVLARPGFDRDPFALGVASGESTPDGFVIWTRVLADPASTAPLHGDAYRLVYDIAEDPEFRRVVRSAEILALPQDAHSVHVEVRGLRPGRDYWYRFALPPDHRGPAGRARTAPAPDQAVDRFDLVFASCQHYETGFYGAWRDAIRTTPGRRPPDAVLFLGDYIYESSIRGEKVRQHGAGKPRTLDEYRRRYALYKSDADLRAAHAAAPWFPVWDDHEVENDYAGDVSQERMDPARFRAIRAAAYRAWWEHMPVRPSMRPRGPDAAIHRRVRFGDLLEIAFLDGRQYRSPQPCPRPGRSGSNNVGADCVERLSPELTMLGRAQEEWLHAGFRAASTRWNLIANQTLVAPVDLMPGPAELRRTDIWDGYPAARGRLLDAVVSSRLANPVVLSGDLHTNIVADLRGGASGAGAVVATEFVGTSISSPGPYRGELAEAALRAENPHVRFATARHRGHVELSIGRDRLSADLRMVEDVRDPATAARTLASFTVESGKPGATPA